MTKRFTTNGYYINDTYHDGRKWLVNEVEAEEIVDVMNGLDTKVRESRKAIPKLQKENEQLEQKIKDKNTYQRVLEAKIRRLKDRIKVLEKNE